MTMVGALVMGLGAAAGASVGPPPPYALDGVSQNLVGVGSDTTYLVMGCTAQSKSSLTCPAIDGTTDGLQPAKAKGILKGFQQGGGGGFNNTAAATKDLVCNVQPASAVSGFPPSTTCTADAVHPASTWPPDTCNGSSAGVTCLKNSNANGTIDFARSSRGPQAGDAIAGVNLEFWAFALDAVTWTHFTNTACPGTDTGPVGCAPSNLTQLNLQDIYGCIANDWSAVGGNAGAIARYTAQLGSGTRSFFESRLLGGQTSDNAGCPSTKIEENDATLVAAGDRPTAILPYSVAKWNSQKKLNEIDKRAGTKLGNVNGVVPVAATITESAAQTTTSTCAVPAGTFCGSRYVHNVTPHLQLPAAANAATTNFVGVNNDSSSADYGRAGYICSGKAKASIIAFGFFALPLANTSQGMSPSYDSGTLGQSNCRIRSL